MNHSIGSVLITGANSGIGKEVARQMAMRSGVERVYLACRNESRAKAAEQELRTRTGKSCFKIVLMDVSSPASVRSSLSTLKDPIDALVMNAGGSGGKTPLALTRRWSHRDLRLKRAGPRRFAGGSAGCRSTPRYRGLCGQRGSSRLSKDGHQAAGAADVIGTGLLGRHHRQGLCRQEVRWGAGVCRSQIHCCAVDGRSGAKAY